MPGQIEITSSLAFTRFRPSIVSYSRQVLKYAVDQMQALRKSCSALKASSANDSKQVDDDFLGKIYNSTKIKTRHMFVSDFCEEDRLQDGKMATTTDQYSNIPIERRLTMFAKQVDALVVETCRQAVKGVDTDEIGMLVVTSSTLISSPGLQHEIIKQLKLKPTVHQFNIVFAGCGAGVNAWRAANLYARGNVGSCALFVCAEASSLHATFAKNRNDAITHSLFSDGVFACVVKMQQPNHGLISVIDEYSILTSGTETGITLSVNANGISCKLDNRLKDFLKEGVTDCVNNLLSRNDLKICDIRYWAIHPGGPRIIEACEQALGITREQTAHSWEVLADYGNMLSASVFFVIDKIVKSKPEGTLPGKGIALAFSPGVTIEGILFEL